MPVELLRTSEVLLTELERQICDRPIGSDTADYRDEENDLEEMSDHTSESETKKNESDEANI